MSLLPLAGVQERLLRPLREMVLGGVRQALGNDPEGLEEYRRPLGDPGLFGPGSIPWVVHADLPAMLIGGFSALMLQTLHPLAMAGVAEHSRYREDPLGRLQRTARYVAGTTFGGMPLVEELVARVGKVHGRVHGRAPDGRPYSAEDPRLLTWVHTTEVWNFLRSYQRYSLRPLLRAEKDRYLEEVAVLGELLGAEGVPRSVVEVRAYLGSVRQELRATPEAREAVTFLRTPLRRSLPEALGHRIVAEAAVELLPLFARRELGLAGPRGLLSTGVLPGAGPLPTRGAAEAAAGLLRWAVGPSLVRQVAAERVLGGGPPRC